MIMVSPYGKILILANNYTFVVNLVILTGVEYKTGSFMKWLK